LKAGGGDVLYRLYLAVYLPHARVPDPGDLEESEDVSHDGLEKRGLHPGQRRKTSVGGDEGDASGSQDFRGLAPCAWAVAVDQERDEWVGDFET
jgi:hypothetical protein